MSVDRVKEEMMVARKDAVLEIVKFDNGFNSLVGPFTFVKFSINTVTLIVAKVPDEFNGVKETWKSREKTGFVNKPREEIIQKVLIL